MATEYGLQDGDNTADLARELIDRAGPENVHWAPRPDTPGGGVFVVNDDQAAADVLKARKLRRDAETARIEEAQKAADERDKAIDGTGVTPAEAGFPANSGTDPGSTGQARLAQEAVEGKHADADPNPAAEQKREAILNKEAEGATVQETTDAETRGAEAAEDDDDDSEDGGSDDGSESTDEQPKKLTPAQRRAKAKADREAAEAAKAESNDDSSTK